MKTQTASPLLGYGIAVATSLLALLPGILSTKNIEPSFALLFLAAVIISAWSGGSRPGLLATVIGAAATLYVLLSHSHSLMATALQAGLQTLLFVLVALFISYLAAAFRQTQVERNQAEEDLSRQLDFTSAITRNLGEGVYALDQYGRVTFMNPTAQHLLGWSEAEVLGRQIQDVIRSNPPEAHQGPLRETPAMEALRSGATVYVESDVYTGRQGATFPVDYVSSPIRAEGEVSGVVVAFRDITQRKAFEEQLKYQATHDALTDLPNRMLFDDRLRQAILAAHREASSLAVLLMDLDRFKEINDTFGHQCGDTLLQDLGARLQGALRESDTVARLGGDEFGMLLPATEASGATLAAAKVLEALKQPFTVEDQTLDIEASIGITLYPEHGTDATALLQRADVAMYTAKRVNEGFAIYASQLDANSPTRLGLIGELRRALDRNELLLHYQPKVDLKTGRSEQVEALVRWQHEKRGLLLPDQYIPLAEHTGLMKPLSLWVLNAALTQSRRWREAGIDMRISVNLSARNLHDQQLPQTIADLLEKSKVSADRLTIEITESTVMADPVRAKEILKDLNDMGVMISIDDFGTGYSSLAHLATLPVQEIKIDKSFVLGMVANEDDAFITRSVIDLGHNLGLKTVAEGVETQQVRDALCLLGCDLAQGYYLAPPMPADEFEQWLSGARPESWISS